MPSGDFDSSSFDLHNNLVKVTTIIASLIMQSLLHTGPCWVPIARPEGSALAWVSLVNLVCSWRGGGGQKGHIGLSSNAFLDLFSLLNNSHLWQVSDGRDFQRAHWRGGPRSEVNVGICTPVQKGLLRIMRTSGLPCGTRGGRGSKWVA